MTDAPEAKLIELGLVLPAAPAAVANYVPTKRVGNLLFVSGQLCLDQSGQLVATGVVGTHVETATAVSAARACALNLLSQVRSAVGSLDQVVSVVRLGGFIAAPADFDGHAGIMNGASDLMVEVFGDAGRHSRSTVGVASLPKQATVEIEGVFELA